MIIAAFLLSLAQLPAVAPSPAGAVPFPSGPRRARRLFISPMGEPFRARSRDDDTLADWFEQADKNHDGRLTIEEMQQDAERFFASLDVNHDGEIDPDEIARYENEVAPEILTGENFAFGLDNAVQEGSAQRSRGNDEHGEGGSRQGGATGRHASAGSYSGSGRPSGFRVGRNDQHQGAARYALLDLPEPVVSADTDFDRGVSLAEFRQAAVQRFLALDLDHHGYLTLAGLETIRPAPPPMPNKETQGN